jgi:hypothetical protein
MSKSLSEGMKSLERDLLQRDSIQAEKWRREDEVSCSIYRSILLLHSYLSLSYFFFLFLFLPTALYLNQLNSSPLISSLPPLLRLSSLCLAEDAG